MTIAFRVFAAEGIVAMFDEASGGGDAHDITAPRNRPANDPSSWLPNIYFHSSLDNMEVVSDTTVTVNHSSVAGSSSSGVNGGAGPGDFGSTGGESQNAAVIRYGASSADRLLVNHGLGYPPIAFVTVGNNVLYPGAIVQNAGDGRGRYCSAYATTTELRLHEWTSVSASTLAAVSIDYRVLIMRQQRAAAGSQALKFDASTGILKLGFDRFSSDRRYLQVVPGGSPFGIAYGKTMDLANGAPRVVNPDGSINEPVPSSMKSKFYIQYADSRTLKVYDPGYGAASMAYSGSFTGPTQILVQAP